MDYLINVALGFGPDAIALVVLYFIANAVLKRLPQTKHANYKKKYTRPIFGGLLLLSLVYNMMQPGITYKNVTFDEAAESRQIEQLNEQKHSKTETLVISDDSKPIEGVGDEEFDDMVEFNNDGRD